MTKYYTCCRNHKIHSQKKILPIHIQKAFWWTIRNLEPLSKGFLAAKTKIACWYVSKEVKENAQSHQRSNPVGPKQNPQKLIKTVCMKQINFMTSSCTKSCGKNIVCSVKIMNLPEYILIVVNTHRKDAVFTNFNHGSWGAVVKHGIQKEFTRFRRCLQVCNFEWWNFNNTRTSKNKTARRKICEC